MTIPPEFDQTFRDRLTELFTWRRDVRRFHDTKLPQGLLEDLLRQACLAPSVGNSQPWRFVTVEDAGRRAGIKQNFAECSAAAATAYRGDDAVLYNRLKLEGLDQAPVHLAVFADSEPREGKGLGRQTMAETVHYSAVCAIHTLWLVARAHGIGLGWLSILDPDVATEILEVPPSWSFIAYLCLGYPLEEHTDPELERHGWQERLEPVLPALRR